MATETGQRPDYVGACAWLIEYRRLWRTVGGDGWRANHAFEMAANTSARNSSALAIGGRALQTARTAAGYTSAADWLRDPDIDRHVRVINAAIQSIHEMSDGCP